MSETLSVYRQLFTDGMGNCEQMCWSQHCACEWITYNAPFVKYYQLNWINLNDIW